MLTIRTRWWWKEYVCVVYLLIHLYDAGHLGGDVNWDSVANSHSAADYIQN